MGKQRLFRRFAVILGLVVLSVLPFASAAAAATPPLIRPEITHVASSATCQLVPCQLSVTLTYNTSVGFSPAAATAFEVKDKTSGAGCPIQSVTLSPVMTGRNEIVLQGTCVVQSGDQMVLLYRETPTGYVYSLLDRSIHALSPQLVTWTQGSVLGCPPLCGAGASLG